MELRAHAKINLFLDVVGRLENGYHNILSLMQSISLCDRIYLSVEDTGFPSVTLSCDAEGVPTDERNLAVRAANAFYRAAGFLKRTEIRIEKRIPVSAGLAGGSTDAAAVLVGLNQLFGERFAQEELCAIGKSLGADIPFCILSGTAEVTGIGEKLRPLPDIAAFPMVVAKRGSGVSTPEAYRKLDGRYDNFEGEHAGGTADSGTYDGLLAALDSGDPEEVSKHLYNVFETVVAEEHDEVRALKAFFLENGATAAMMSGSGPSVFAIFRTDEEASRATERLNREAGEELAFYVHPVRRYGDAASAAKEEA